MATLDIEWRHLELAGETCDRCEETGKTLKNVLDQLSTEIGRRGHTLHLTETPLGRESLADSNLILINGRPLEDWLAARPTETNCTSCGDLLGESACCRAVEVAGITYEAIPEALIRAAVLAAIQNQTPTKETHPMKDIKVLGSGCRNCETTAKLIQDTAAAKGVAINLEKVTDMAAILGYGVMSTPGVVIDGKVVHAGGIPDRKTIEGWLM